MDIYNINENDLKNIILSQISKVSFDTFRQDDIVSKYNKEFQKLEKIYTVLQCKANVSSGVQNRELVKTIGKMINRDHT